MKAMSSAYAQYPESITRARRRGQLLAGQRGFVLIATMLLLIVMTLLALAMFRNIDVQELVASNVREKQRAFHAAVDAEQYAEYWLSINDNALSMPATCSGVTSANTAVVQICSNVLPTVVDTGVTTLPWTIGGNPVGFTYNPGNGGDMTISNGGGINSYYGLPTFYISALPNASATNGQQLYQIDSWGYGGSSGTVAEIETTWQVTLQVNSNVQGGSTGN